MPYNVNWGDNLPLILLITFALVLLSIGLGTLIGMVARNEMIAGGVLNVLIPAFTFIAGGYFKFTAPGPFFAALQHVSPNYLAQTAILNTIYGGPAAQTAAFLGAMWLIILEYALRRPWQSERREKQLIIFAHTLKRILRNKVYLLVMLLAPALMTGFIFGFAGTGGYLAMNLVDLDDTPLTRMLAEDLAKKALLPSWKKREQIRSALAGGRADYALVIEAGFYRSYPA